MKTIQTVNKVIIKPKESKLMLIDKETQEPIAMFFYYNTNGNLESIQTIDKTGHDLPTEICSLSEALNAEKNFNAFVRLGKQFFAIAKEELREVETEIKKTVLIPANIHCKPIEDPVIISKKIEGDDLWCEKRYFLTMKVKKLLKRRDDGYFDRKALENIIKATGVVHKQKLTEDIIANYEYYNCTNKIYFISQKHDNTLQGTLTHKINTNPNIPFMIELKRAS